MRFIERDVFSLKELREDEAQPAGRVAPLDEPGFFNDFGTAVALDTSLGQASQELGVMLASDRVEREGWALENKAAESSDYSPFDDPSIDMMSMPMNLIEEIYNANSRAEVDRTLFVYQENLKRREQLQHSTAARFLAQIAEPANLIPIPIAAGRGLWTGMKAAAPANIVAMTAAESIRHNLDPSSTIEETAMNVGSGVIFGEILAGMAGTYKPGMMRGATNKIPKWMGRDVVKQAASKMENAQRRWEIINDRLQMDILKDRKATRVRRIDEKRFNEEVKPTLSGEATYDDWLDGKLSDGLPASTSRYQGTDGEQHIITPDQNNEGVWIHQTRQNGGEWTDVSRGTFKEVSEGIDRSGTRFVESFDTPEAYVIAHMKMEDLYPDAPSPKDDPEGYQAWRDENEKDVGYDDAGNHIIDETLGEIEGRIGLDLDRELRSRQRAVEELEAERAALNKQDADHSSRLDELNAELKKAKARHRRAQKNATKVDAEELGASAAHIKHMPFIKELLNAVGDIKNLRAKLKRLSIKYQNKKSFKKQVDEYLSKHGEDPHNLFDKVIDLDKKQAASDKATAKLEQEQALIDDILNEIQLAKTGDNIDINADSLEVQKADLDSQIQTARDRLKITENQVADSKLSDDPEDWDIRPTMTGLEQAFGSTGQMPWYRIVKTRLRDIAPDLAAEWQRIAYELAGSPGLASNGHGRGLSTGPSVESHINLWLGEYNSVKAEVDRIYFEDYMKIGKGPTPAAIFALQKRQNAGRMVDKILKRDEQEGRKLTVDEFRVEVGKALMNNDKVATGRGDGVYDEHVAKAARTWRKFIERIEGEAKLTGVFRQQEELKTGIRINEERIADLESSIEMFKRSNGVEESKELQDLMQVNEDVNSLIKKYNKEHIEQDDPHRRRARVVEDHFDELPPKTQEYLATRAPWTDLETGESGRGLIDSDIRGGDFSGSHFYLLDESIDQLRMAQLSDDIIDPELQKIIDEYELQIDELWIENMEIQAEMERIEMNSDIWKDGIGDDAWMHRVWDLGAIKKNQDMMLELLKDWYKKNPYTIHDGIETHYSQKPEDIEARAQETLENILNEAIFNDGMGLMNKSKAQMKAATKGLLYKKKEELDAMKEKSPTAAAGADGKKLKAQIRALQHRLDTKRYPGAGTPRALLSRKLNIPNKLLINLLNEAGEEVNFVHTHSEEVLFNYTNRMASVIETARKYGDFRMKRKLDDLRLQIDEKILATDDPVLRKALAQEKEEMTQAVQDLRDKVLGTYGIPTDPSAISVRTVRLLMAFNTMTAMGRAFLTAINDIGMVVQVQGVRRTFGDLLDVMANARSESSQWKLSKYEVEAVGQAMEINNAIRSRQITDTGDGGMAFTSTEKFIYDQQGTFFFLNLLSGWTDFAKRFSGSIIQSKMIKNSIEWRDGKISKIDMEEMAKAGLTKEHAIKIADEWEAAGSQRGKDGEGLYLASTADWMDPEITKIFRASLSQAIDNIIIAPKAADKPNFMSHEIGRMIMQYHGFSMAATHRIFMSNMQKRDKRALSVVMSMIGLSFIIDAIKRPDYISLSAEDQLYRAIELSGTLGIISDLGTMMDGATGGDYGPRAALGLQNLERHPDWASRVGSIAGAVPNQWLGPIAAATADNDNARKMARAVRYMLPYNNFWLWNDMVTRSQRTVVDAVE